MSVGLSSLTSPNRRAGQPDLLDCLRPTARNPLEEVLERWDADLQAVGFLDGASGGLPEGGEPGRIVQYLRAAVSVRHSRSKSGATSPFSPGRSTSRTGGTSAPSTTQPVAIALSIDHDSTKGAVR